MGQTIANMATFPQRENTLAQSISSICDQVDRVNLVLNEYSEVPKFLLQFRNVEPIIPTNDLKDTGKFLPECSGEDLVFLVDDDLFYSSGYVSLLLRRANELGLEENVLGLHGTVYRKNLKGLRSRKRFDFASSQKELVYVDQLGTGTILVLGKNLPPFEYMRTSQKFVDVRFAKWCAENELNMISVPRPKATIRSIRVSGSSIYRSFTSKSPEHVLNEVREFAGKNQRIKQSHRSGLF